MIDLHIHTTNSDGTDSTLEILKKAENLKLTHISITDHEKCDAYEELETIDIKKYFSGKIIKGTELKSYYKDRIIDILGYSIDTKVMKKSLDDFYKDKTHEVLQKKYLKHFYEQAKELNLKIDDINNINWNPAKDWASVVFYNEIKKYEENKVKLPEDLWSGFDVFKKDYCYNRKNHFFIDKSEDLPSVQDTINRIHKSGGKAFLAHVYEYKWVQNKIEFIKELLQIADFDGIECYYSNFSQEQTEELLDFCKKNNLYASGGSDYHGKNKKNIELGIGRGNLAIPEEILKWI